MLYSRTRACPPARWPRAAFCLVSHAVLRSRLEIQHGTDAIRKGHVEVVDTHSALSSTTYHPRPYFAERQRWPREPHFVSSWEATYIRADARATSTSVSRAKQ